MKSALWLGALATIILLVACGKTADPAEVLRRFLAAVDRGDAIGALALTTDDAVFDVLGCPPGACKGTQDCLPSNWESSDPAGKQHQQEQRDKQGADDQARISKQRFDTYCGSST